MAASGGGVRREGGRTGGRENCSGEQLINEKTDRVRGEGRVNRVRIYKIFRVIGSTWI